MNKRTLAAVAFGALALSGCTTVQRSSQHRPLAPGGIYVAMGSSFAAGPGITQSADTPPTRCGRSIDNYAHQLARKRGLRLMDVSCGGATTANLLGRWSELPPQLDALTPDTVLITATVGGNDVGYIGGLLAASCQAAGRASCRAPAETTEQTWQKLESDMRSSFAEMRRRAPRARIIIVDYPVVMPDRGQCDATPLPVGQADKSRAVADRLARLTARVTKEAGVELLQASRLTHGHDACAADPWMNGFVRPAGDASFAPYHPRLAGMTAIADALDRMID